MKKKKLIVYPILIFLYPVLSLWAENVRDVLPSQVQRGLLFSVIAGVLLWAVCWLLFRRWDKSALAASTFFLLIFSYGHLYNFLVEWNERLARHRFLLPIYVCLITAWILMLSRGGKRVGQWHSIFMIAAPALLFLPAYTLGSALIIDASSQRLPPVTVNKVENPGQRPDIYYIILDAYGREDILREYYEYDNSAFISYLENAGFYVADSSHSNYISTILSLSSSLNMQYVDVLLPEAEPRTSDEVQLAGYEEDLLDFIRHSNARSFLAERGYRLVTYDNNFKTTIRDADVLFSYSPLSRHSVDNKKSTGFVINSFEGLLLETSIARLWLDWQAAHGRENILFEAPYLTHRALTIDMFESLKEISRMDGDNFVFMHFLVPHPPFVFGKNGEAVKHNQTFTLADGVNYSGTRRNYMQGYTQQLIVTNEYLEDTISYIINNSNPKPIIIIQGDHGPRASLNFRNPKKTDIEGPFGNLNAYYFPDFDHAELYPEITPVNSFRVVFNSYFGADMELLPDENYLSTSVEPFNFTNVTELVK